VTRFLLETVEAWIEDRPPPPLPKDLDVSVSIQGIRTNRLEPLMDRCLADEISAKWPEARQQLRDAHRRCLAQTLRYEAAASTLFEKMNSMGIPCIGLRGPFADAELYGNEGRRAFTDLDLLVPERFKQEALHAMQALCYDFRSDAFPAWFYSRHHLHWPLLGRDSHIACDVHWTIDHPYSLLAIDYNAIFCSSRSVAVGDSSWRRPEPGHALLMQAAHLAKESASRSSSNVTTDFADRVMGSGQLLKWIDFALMLKAYSPEMDWQTLAGTANEWKMNWQLDAALRGCNSLFPGSVPPEASSCFLAASLPRPGERSGVERALSCLCGRALSQRGGFRATRLADAMRFLWPPEMFFRNRKGFSLLAARTRHSARASMKLSRALADGLICMLIMAFQSRKARTLSRSSATDRRM